MAFGYDFRPSGDWGTRTECAVKNQSQNPVVPGNHKTRQSIIDTKAPSDVLYIADVIRARNVDFRFRNSVRDRRALNSISAHIQVDADHLRWRLSNSCTRRVPEFWTFQSKSNFPAYDVLAKNELTAEWRFLFLFFFRVCPN